EGVNYKDEDNLKGYLNDILDNPKACLVKTADRKHNFSTLYATSEKHEIRQADETEKFFIPFFKKARKKYPQYSAYFHSAKTTIMPHLKRIQKAHEDQKVFNEKIEKLKSRLDLEIKENMRLRDKLK